MSSVPSEEQAQRQYLRTQHKNVQPSPDTLSKLVKRLRVLTLNLLPVEVEADSLTDVTSRVITPAVITAYTAAAGDFVEALPYCLLRARKEFMWDADHSPADYDENYGRAMACEVLARRIIHQAPRERLVYMMSNRFQTMDWDGDESDLVSALEIAIDSHCIFFLSSNEAQDLVNSVWSGDLITRRKDHNHMEYVAYPDAARPTDTFIDPSRMSIPRYQNLFRIFTWLVFLGVYSQAVREPLDKVHNKHDRLDPTEIIMYVLALAYAFEDIHKFYKLLKFVTIRSFTFWLLVSILTDTLFLTAFSIRMFGIWSKPGEDTIYRLRAFQILSFVAPLIWMKLITIFDGYKYVGTMEICIARMMRESGIFFALLSILGAGFAQGLYALDAADEDVSSAGNMVHLLIQALLQSPAYDQFSNSLPGLSLYYLWNVATAVILLNVLVSLFSSAYDDVVEDAEAEYLTYFAGKTVEMVRAPDSYVYPAPANIMEIFLIGPFELVLSAEAYAKLNRFALSILFFIPLTMISFYERALRSRRNYWLKSWFRNDAGEGEEDTPATRDPDTAHGAEGLQISRVKFEELTTHFPDVTLSTEAVLRSEVREVRAQLDEVLRRLDEMSGAKKSNKSKKKKKSGSSGASSSE